MLIPEFRGRKCNLQRDIVAENGREFKAGSDFVTSGQVRIKIDPKVGRVHTLFGLWPDERVEVRDLEIFVDVDLIVIYG